MQIEFGDKYLHIQGFVSPETLAQMPKSLTSKPGAWWFFVEYAPATYAKGTTFNFIIDDIRKKFTQEYYNIHLVDIVDQFGYHHDEISEGWKMICQFAIDSLPAIITKLPILDTWKYNPNGVKLVSFSDLNIQDEDTFAKEIYMHVFDDIISWATHADPVSRKEFAHTLWSIINTHKEEIEERASSEFVRKVEHTLHSI